MNERGQLSLWPTDEHPLDNVHEHLVGEHPGDGLDDDDWFPPDPNYLAQFREPTTEADMVEMARILEEAVIEFLTECEAKEPPR